MHDNAADQIDKTNQRQGKIGRGRKFFEQQKLRQRRHKQDQREAMIDDLFCAGPHRLGHFRDQENKPETDQNIGKTHRP